MIKLTRNINYNSLLLVKIFGFLLWSQLSANHYSVDLDYSKWDELLQKHVSADGVVNYRGFYTDKEKLIEFTMYLSEHTPNSSWSEHQKKAYFINTYNANTVRLIIEHYPVNSIKDIAGGLSNVFKKKFIDFEGKQVSLDDIEKSMLLPMGDARVHFAINCASKSCPKLANYAFKAQVLDDQLDNVTTAFVNSSNVEVVDGQVYLSKIFKWYDNDFKDAAGSVINFINTYAETKIGPDSKLEYLDYSWDLNGTN